MSNQKNIASNILTGLKLHKFAFSLFLFLIPLYPVHHFSYANDFSSNNYQLTYEKNLISISASKADLKNILIEIAEKAGISIRYPATLDKKITIKINDISLKNALSRLLKDFNYSIIYTGSKKRAAISEVYVLKKNRKSPAITSNNTRINNRIKSYERRIESITRSLAGVDESSARGKRYLRQIKSYESTIENLKRQLQ